MLYFATSLFGHVVSMSSGELHVAGTHATYELRMPMYEFAHVANPETALLEHVSFSGAERKSAECAQDGDTYVCRATYEFPAPVDRLRAECTLFRITVPNHVHILRATRGENLDQVVFDQSFTRAEIRFRPPSAAERIAGEVATGAARGVVSVAGLLFLLALVAASRSTKEVALLAVMFLIGEWIARPIAPRIPWQLSTRFLEAAMGLTVAYLAVETLTLPKAGQRWAVVLALGLFHGLYYAAFPATYLAGATLTQLANIAILAVVARRAPPAAPRYVVWGLLIAGLGWFATRLIP
jgi:hypothetical protein